MPTKTQETWFVTKGLSMVFREQITIKVGRNLQYTAMLKLVWGWGWGEELTLISEALEILLY